MAKRGRRPGRRSNGPLAERGEAAGSAGGFGLLKERLAVSSARARPPEPSAGGEPALEPPLLRLTETEVMHLAFESLGADAPRLDVSRVVVVAEPIGGAAGWDPADTKLAAAGEASPGRGATSTDDAARLRRERAARRRARALALARARERLAAKPWQGEDWEDAVPVAISLTQDPRLDPAARALLRRARGQRPPTVHLRYLARAAALTQLDAFVSTFSAQGRRFVRVVCGKGRSSRGAPVIKPAVIDWCERSPAVVGLAPELDADGDFGSVILELRSRARRPVGA